MIHDAAWSRGDDAVVGVAAVARAQGVVRVTEASVIGVVDTLPEPFATTHVVPAGTPSTVIA